MNGIDVICIAVGLLLLAVERYVTWQHHDRYRRLERRAHLNLTRNLR